MTTEGQSRVLGAAMMVVGLGFVGWTWKNVASTGGYSVPLVFIGPVIVAVGLGALIHTPPLPAPPESVLTRYTWAGVAVALIHWALVHFSDSMDLVQPP